MDHKGSKDSGHIRMEGRKSGGNEGEDDLEDVLNNTLYELTDLQEYTARKVEADDITQIRNLLKDEDYSQFRFEDPLILYESCCFSLAISDIIETDRLVAAAFFDDKPASPDLMKNAKKWKPANELKFMSPINTYHMRCFVCSPEVAEDVCITEIISHTFSSSIHIDYIVAEMPHAKHAYAISPLVKEIEVHLGKQRRKLYVYQKDLLMPHLIVREGREHDLDDLTPLLPMEATVMEQHFGKTNLSDIISLSERGSKSMTAEWKNEAIGIISVSADIDYVMLNNLYHLSLFHGLRKPHMNDEIYIDKDKQSVFKGIANALAVKLFNMSKKHMPRHMDMFRDIFKAFPNREYLIVTCPVGGNAREPPWLDGFVRVIPKSETSYPRDLFVIHKVPITSKIRVRRAKDRDIGPVKGFLNSLFEKEKIFEDFLQCLHKSMFPTRCINMNAYLAQVKNYEGTPIIGLVIVSQEGEATKYAVNYDLEKHTYFGAHDDPGAHGYVHHLIVNPIFQRHARLILKEVMRQDEKECLFHRVYPEFISNDSTHHQTILNNMEDWIPLVPRKRIHYDDLNLVKAYDDERQPFPYAQLQDDPYPFAVLHTAKKFIMEHKIVISKRLVFVGASTTALSCIAKLISSTYRSFKYLTVIDPFGLPGSLPDDPVRNQFFGVRNGGTRMSYKSDAEWVQRAGIHLWVKVVKGKVTKIVREAKYVVVNAECVVPYDKLVLSTGLQFQRLDCPEPEINNPNFLAFKKNTSASTLEPGSNRTNFKRDAPKPRNVFTINHEVEAEQALEYIRENMQLLGSEKMLIFGGGLQTFACIKALLACGVPPKSIILINTPDNEIEWEKKSGYLLSPKVRDAMEVVLASLGINLISNYEFDFWDTSPVNGRVNRTHFKSLTEEHPYIAFDTFAVFCYRYRRIDDDIVSACSEAYILCQSGVTIDIGFLTNDPDIYAAGPATTYQKILLADHQNHIYYQSEEIGHKLADLLIDLQGTDEVAGEVVQTHVPIAGFKFVVKFTRPFIRALALPGGWYYLYLRNPGSLSRCETLPGSICEETCECLTEVVTGSLAIDEDPEQKFFKVKLDDKDRIVSLECMSQIPFSFSNISSLYGKHEVILNKMMERLELGETTCLYNHFKQSWFAVFCIDEWDAFAEELKDLYKEHDIGDGTKLIEFIRDFIANLDNPEALQMDPNIIRSVWRSSKLMELVEEKMLNFLNFHRTSLPMYAQHHWVEDLLEERTQSALYYPNTKAHMAHQ